MVSRVSVMKSVAGEGYPPPKDREQQRVWVIDPYSGVSEALEQFLEACLVIQALQH